MEKISDGRFNCSGYGSLSSRSNPFALPPTSELFFFREDELKKKEEKNRISRLSLVERQNLIEPPIPQYLLQKMTQVPTKKNEKKKTRRVRSQRTAEFISEKREIYLTQLLIDKKEQEIDKIKKQMEKGDELITNTVENMVQISSKMKNANASIETKLSQQRKATELALHNRVEMSEKFLVQVNNISIIKSELTKNQDLLQLYRQYYNFMKTIVPDDKSPEDFYEVPTFIEDALNDIEQDNLFLLQHAQHIEELINRGHVNLEEEIINTQNLVDALSDRIEKLIPLPELNIEPSQADVKKVQETEEELTYLSQLISMTFQKCFHEEPNLGAVAMLTKLEDTLEQMYRELKLVDPDFVHLKQQEINKERRNIARIKMQSEKEKLLQIKKEAALARATKPVKKKLGRPLVSRTVPQRNIKKDQDKELELIRRKEEVNKLLFEQEVEY